MNRISIFVVVATSAVGALLAFMDQLGLGLAVWIAVAITSQSLKIADWGQKFILLRAVRRQSLAIVSPVPHGA